MSHEMVTMKAEKSPTYDSEPGQIKCPHCINNITHCTHRYNQQEAAADFQPHLPHQVRRRSVSHSSLLHRRPSEQHPGLLQAQKLRAPRPPEAQPHPHGHLELRLRG